MKKIRYIKPSRVSEANVQAMLFMALYNNGINCYLEYRMGKIKGRGCRVDIALLDKHREYIIAIIECKSVKPDRYAERKKSIEHTKQIKRYSEFGVPVLTCLCFNDIGVVVEDCKRILEEFEIQEFGKLDNYK